MVWAPARQELQVRFSDVQHLGVIPMKAACGASLMIQDKVLPYIEVFNWRGFAHSHTHPHPPPPPPTPSSLMYKKCHVNAKGNTNGSMNARKEGKTAFCKCSKVFGVPVWRISPHLTISWLFSLLTIQHIMVSSHLEENNQNIRVFLCFFLPFCCWYIKKKDD